jgi:hypothetical protein
VSGGLCTGVATETEVTVVTSGRNRNVNVAAVSYRRLVGDVRSMLAS